MIPLEAKLFGDNYLMPYKGCGPDKILNEPKIGNVHFLIHEIYYHFLSLPFNSATGCLVIQLMVLAFFQQMIICFHRTFLEQVYCHFIFINKIMLLIVYILPQFTFPLQSKFLDYFITSSNLKFNNFILFSPSLFLCINTGY